MKSSFIIHTSFYEPIKVLSDKQLGRIFRALFDYQLGNVVQVEDDIKMAFMFFKNQMDIDGQKYQNKIEINKQNGAKGGAPKGNNNARKKTTKTTENNQTVEKTTKTTLNDNDNDNDNDFLLKKETKEIAHEKTPFEKFNEWIIENAPYCAKKLKQLTEKEFEKLKENHTATVISETIMKIENRKDLRKNYTNLYRTLLNWLKNEHAAK